jgi:5,10-methylenetetrahydromethanopterin reductase
VKLGGYLYGDPNNTADQSRVLERHGFSNVWFGEIPTWGFCDSFQGMRDAALATTSIAVGTAITPAGVRPPATLVTQLGTLNASAPGRVTVGLGTGILARAVLGLAPLRFSEFRAEVQRVRALMDGDEVCVNGQPIAFRQPSGGLRLDQSIRLLVAGGGPRTAGLAGEFGDGLLATGIYDPGKLAKLKEQTQAGARRIGRRLGDFAFVLEAGPVCIVRDGEDLSSPRVLATVEPFVTMYFVLAASLGTTPDEVPVAAADSYAQFLARVASQYGANPRGRLLHSLSTTAYLRQPTSDSLITPGVIAACTLTGHHSELRDRLSDMARAGVTDLAILRARSYQWTDGTDIEELLRLVEAV